MQWICRIRCVLSWLLTQQPEDGHDWRLVGSTALGDSMCCCHTCGKRMDGALP